MRRSTRRFLLAATAFTGLLAVVPASAQAQNTYADFPYNQGSLMYRPSGLRSPRVAPATRYVTAPYAGTGYVASPYVATGYAAPYVGRSYVQPRGYGLGRTYVPTTQVYGAPVGQVYAAPVGQVYYPAGTVMSGRRFYRGY